MTGFSTPTPQALAAALGQFPPTDEQAAVIASPLGPALVVAGAGSGKTETMAARVVWLVAGGAVRRDAILGLTFTRKAAGELSDRIRRRLARLDEFERAGLVPHLNGLLADGRLDVFAQLERRGAPARERHAALNRLAKLTSAVAGTPDADVLLQRPTVATYNAFADGIVREHGLRIGRDPDAAVMADSAAWLLMRRVVYASDDPRLEQLGRAPGGVIDAALRLARDMVDNDVRPAEVAEFAAAFQRVRDLPSVRRGTVVYADVAKAADAVGALDLLADLASEYNRRKLRRGVLDFADQVAGALRIVSSAEDVAQALRDRYRVVLLDEYQDTSVLQTRLLSTLFGGGAVMAVGDPHQAIYGWRGASAGNLGGFRQAFARDAGCRTFSLMTSWRNGVRVLQAAQAVLAPLTATSPVVVGRLQPRPGADPGVVDIHVADDLDAEAAHVAEWFDTVRARRRAQNLTTTGAVLFRAKKHMLRFAEALAERGVPHRVLGLGGLLSTPEVVDVVCALRVISDPQAGSALIRLLAGPRWHIGLPDLRALAACARAAAARPGDAAAGGRRTPSDEPPSIVDALDALSRLPDGHPRLAGLTPVARVRLREAGAVFRGLRESAAASPVDLIHLIVRELHLDIELAANEARGPVRVASAQLRAFVDEVRAFLAIDDTGSLRALLAWLDHAERADDLAPRTEPPEPDVVQLLTIHGAKGLEWDAVAVVRMVDGELPTGARDTHGWLGFGVLPYDLRGDAAWLPALSWRTAATQQDLKSAMEQFAAANRDRQIREDRRLAYVAVTRARDRLLLTGSPWAGTRNPRRPSPFLVDIARELHVALPDTPTVDDRPDTSVRTLQWPMDALGSRRGVVMRAAQAVRAASRAPAATPDRDVALLLAERERAGRPDVTRAPVRIPASAYKDYVADYAATVASLRHPVPERPYARTRIGTMFHAWVERRSGLVGTAGSLDDALFEADEADESGPDDEAASSAADDQLRTLQEAFSRSEWAPLQPIAVETEIDFPFTDLDGTTHLAICKLDAVYRRGDRIEIVDWKTGSPPRNAAEEEARMLQLQLYRRAYHAKHGVPLESIDVVLFYVAHGIVLRD